MPRRATHGTMEVGSQVKMPGITKNSLLRACACEIERGT